MGIWRNGWKPRGRFFGVALLTLSLLPFAARAQSNAWDVAILDRILANVQPGQTVAQVGDMFMQVSYLQAWRSQLAGGAQSLLAFQGPTIPVWTGGNVYYTFSNNVSTAHQKMFLNGMNEWAMFAKLQFTARTTQSNYVTIVDGGMSQEGGDSMVGMIGGQQIIHIGSTSWNRPTICHELGHTLGLIHEHQRSDRDSYVTILTNNISPGQEGNFIKLTTSQNETAYDFLSVMHYSRNALSITNILDTIVPTNGYTQYLNIMGQQSDPVLSASDRAGMALVYGAPTTPVTNIVINTQDSGYGSLRAAMYYAFDNPGTTIKFNIPTSDPGFSNSVFTVQPTAPLPSMVNQMTIDGTTEPTNSNPNGPEIVINGSLAALPDVYANGLQMRGTNCAVKGLVIDGFNESGIDIEGSNTTGNVVSGCYIGVDPSGSFSIPNYGGVVIGPGATANTIGGTVASARNVISGNIYRGILITGSNAAFNIVEGNYIGLNSAGTAAISNSYEGIAIFAAAPSNTVGGTVTGAGNVISGNGGCGITIVGTGAVVNVVQGNFIGLDATGTTGISNGLAGVQINFAAQSNLVGGTSSAARNVISGNNKQGVFIAGANTAFNVVEGNYIGLNAAGTGAVANVFAGVEITEGAASNLVGGATPGAGNVVSGNSSQGVAIDGTAANVVQGNFIGTDRLGITAVGNQFAGVEILDGSASNVIGGTTTAVRNLISGNLSQGVFIDGAGSDDNFIEGNYIGVNVAGAAALGNGSSGIELCCNARSNVLGGTASGAGNLVSGNNNFGIVVDGAGTDGTVIQGNLIGVNTNGTSAFPNVYAGVQISGGARFTQIGGATPGARNIISGNLSQGVVIYGSGTTTNLVQGNYIGVDITGTTAIPNSFSGVQISGGCQSNVIGGGVGARNIISGNLNYGVYIADTNTDANIVQGNTIGLDVTSSKSIPNQFAGVIIFDAARSNQVGGTTFGSANLIASNASDGVQVWDTGSTNNTIRGNSIFGNSGFGIALYNSANKSRSAPALSSAVLGTNLTVGGMLTSSSNAAFRIEFFANPPGTIQGKNFLGAITATTGSGGTVTFSAGLASTVPVGQLITATATDPSGNTSPFSTAQPVTTTDSVGDGIPDAWRAAFFGGSGTTTNKQSCATCDPDGDGFTNLQEFHAGTNPKNSSSVIRITSVQPSGPDVVVGFPSVLGKLYRVEMKDDITLTMWTLLVDQIAGTGGVVTITDPGAASLPKRFYRADVLP